MRTNHLLSSALVMSSFALAGSAFAGPSACDAVVGNLIVDCGFENNQQKSWTSSGSHFGLQGDGVRVHSGGGSWDFGGKLGFPSGIYPDQGRGYLSQTVATVVGASYSIDFWLLSSEQFDPSPHSGVFLLNEFNVGWGGTQLFDLIDFNPFLGPDNFVHYAISVTATSTSTELKIGGFHNISAYVVDDLVVRMVDMPAAVPEPSSTALVGGALLGWSVARRRRAK